jgi:hypothetical protein
MNRQDMLKVAAAAGVDPRTVERALDPDGPQRPRSASTRAALITALAAEGFDKEAKAVEKRWRT